MQDVLVQGSPWYINETGTRKYGSSTRNEVSWARGNCANLRCMRSSSFLVRMLLLEWRELAPPIVSLVSSAVL